MAGNGGSVGSRNDIAVLVYEKDARLIGYDQPRHQLITLSMLVTVLPVYVKVSVIVSPTMSTPETSYCFVTTVLTLFPE
jgi:hypothetical protein